MNIPAKMAVVGESVVNIPSGIHEMQPIKPSSQMSPSELSACIRQYPEMINFPLEYLAKIETDVHLQRLARRAVSMAIIGKKIPGVTIIDGATAERPPEPTPKEDLPAT